MASKNMKKIKKRLLNLRGENSTSAVIEQHPRNAVKLFGNEDEKKEMQGWPSHFTTKRVK